MQCILTVNMYIVHSAIFFVMVNCIDMTQTLLSPLLSVVNPQFPSFEFLN